MKSQPVPVTGRGLETTTHWCIRWRSWACFSCFPPSWFGGWPSGGPLVSNPMSLAPSFRFACARIQPTPPPRQNPAMRDGEGALGGGRGGTVCWRMGSPIWQHTKATFGAFVTSFYRLREGDRRRVVSESGGRREMGSETGRERWLKTNNRPRPRTLRSMTWFILSFCFLLS